MQLFQNEQCCIQEKNKNVHLSTRLLSGLLNTNRNTSDIIHQKKKKEEQRYVAHDIPTHTLSYKLAKLQNNKQEGSSSIPQVTSLERQYCLPNVESSAALQKMPPLLLGTGKLQTLGQSGGNNVAPAAIVGCCFLTSLGSRVNDTPPIPAFMLMQNTGTIHRSLRVGCG